MGTWVVAEVYRLLTSNITMLGGGSGQSLTAIRDGEAASESQGIDVKKVKFYVFILAAFGTGMVGALYYLNALRISPTAAYDLNWVVFPIFIGGIGGIGTLEGPIIFFAMRALLADYGSWYLMVLGLVAIVIMMKWPKGIWGSIQQRYNLRFFPVQRRVLLPKIPPEPKP